MGVTIHYNGKLDNRARLQEMLDAARLFCAEQRWMYRDVDEHIIGVVERVVEKQTTVVKIEGAKITNSEVSTASVPIDDSLTGILITVHPEAEPVWLTFNDANRLVYYMPLNDRGVYWEIKSLYTNTQRSGVATHMAICELLHLLQDNYFPNLHVYDEGGYFESGDEQQLKYAIRSLDNVLDRFQNAMQDAESEDDAADAPNSGNPDSPETDDDPKPVGIITPVQRNKKIPLTKPPWKRGHGSGARKN